MMGLTPRQADCLAFIRKRLENGQVAPTYEEIAGHLGIVKSNAHRMVHALAERGHIQMIRNRERSIALVEGGVTKPMEAGLALLSRITGKSRDQLVAQAVEEFLERQVRR
jgi:SOS-response transcriptional repressor LexA